MIKRVLRWLLGGFMVAIGVGHFVRPEPFVAIVPAWLPWALALVYVSGAAEIALGFGVLHPRTRPVARWLLVALYVAVYPANINMAVNQIQLPGLPPAPVWALWARLPLQAVLILWALWCTRAERPKE